MNPRRVTDFLKSKFGLFLVFVLILFGGLWIYGSRQSEKRESKRHAASKKVELGQVRIPLDQGLENGLPLQARPAPGDTSEKASNGIVPFRPPAATAQRAESKLASTPAAKAQPKPKKIRHPSLLTLYEPPKQTKEKPKPSPPEIFIPFGTLLKAKLINTIDSVNFETPIIAVLLEDVWQNGRLVIPANTLMHGMAKAGRLRDRVTASGGWRFVWQDGRELPFNAVALDREYDHEINGYGITDGSAGLRGRILTTDDLQELKLLTAAALSGFARGTQDRTQNAMGTTIQGSVQNGVREGAGQVFDLYAQRTLKDIEENGTYVRVAAGKEFYVYVLRAVDPAQATLAGVKDAPEISEPIPNQG